MTFLPILERELLTRARSRGTYWTRFVVALMGVLVCLQSMESGTFGSPALMGRHVFNGIVAAAFLVSCSICFLTADAISSERREGTLRLLFLTRVRAVDVLLGKLGSVGLASLCALAAFLPVLMVPVLAGGVTGGEAFRKGLGLLNALFLALVAGLCASAAQHERFKAVRGAVLLVGLMVIVPFLAFAVATRGLAYYVGMFSPLTSVVLAGDIAYSAAPRAYWGSLAVVQLVAWMLILGAGFRLRRAARDEEAEELPAPAPPPEETAREVGLGMWQPVKGEASLVEWLVYRRYGVSAGIWSLAVLGLAYSGWVPLSRFGGGNRLAWVFSWPLATVAGLMGGGLVAWVASRFFVGVRQTGDLELLLTTPLGAQSIVADQWKVLKRIFVWPVLVMQAPILPQLLAALAPSHVGIAPELQAAFFSRLMILANVFLGTMALCWLALWFGLKARTQAGAIVWTVGLGKGVPSLVGLLWLVFWAEMSGPSAGPTGHIDAVLAWLPESGLVVFYLWAIEFAKRRLATELAGAGPEPFKPGPFLRAIMGVDGGPA